MRRPLFSNPARQRVKSLGKNGKFTRDRQCPLPLIVTLGKVDRRGEVHLILCGERPGLAFRLLRGLLHLPAQLLGEGLARVVRLLPALVLRLVLHGSMVLACDFGLGWIAHGSGLVIRIGGRGLGSGMR
jgi:hypothetical protein